MTRLITKCLVTLNLLAAATSSHAASFGKTPGQFNVSPVGAAQYSIPIWVPPGPKGIQPHLAISYDSNAGVGPLGIGWSITGLGAISRCNKTYAQDTVPAVVSLQTTDGYCLNGNRLRLTSGNYSAAGSTYQTEIANFSQVTANGATGNGPSSFTVKGKDGLTYQYGFTDANGNGANSQVAAGGTAYIWYLSKVIDRAGNNMVINYVAPNGTTLAGTSVPDTILWTPTSAGASSYTYSLKFNYTTNVPQSSLAKYLAGNPVLNAELLSSIAISNQGTLIKEYFMGYQSSPTTGRYELNWFKECADSAQSNCLLATGVSYQNGTTGLSSTASTALTSSGPGLAARYDLNGDGIPDLVYNNAGSTVYVAFGSKAGGYGTPINTGLPF